MDISKMKWPCQFCGEYRPDEAISVRHVDLSKQYKMSAGCVISNIKYCNDSVECLDKLNDHYPLNKE